VHDRGSGGGGIGSVGGFLIVSKRLRALRAAVESFAIARSRLGRCGSTLRLIAAIEDPAVARAILECLGLPAWAPPTAGAAPEPRDSLSGFNEAFEFDQTPVFDER
jgi:hypothetical protein